MLSIFLWWKHTSLKTTVGFPDVYSDPLGSKPAKTAQLIIFQVCINLAERKLVGTKDMVPFEQKIFRYCMFSHLLLLKSIIFLAECRAAAGSCLNSDPAIFMPACLSARRTGQWYLFSIAKTFIYFFLSNSQSSQFKRKYDNYSAFYKGNVHFGRMFLRKLPQLWKQFDFGIGRANNNSQKLIKQAIVLQITLIELCV